MPWYKKTKWRWLIGLGLLWLAFTVLYPLLFLDIGPDQSRQMELGRFVLLSISAFGVLFSVLLSSFNSVEASQNLRARVNFDRTENAFEFMKRWESEALRDARDMTREVKKEAIELSDTEIRRRISEDEGLERSVITMFNFFEEIELAIESGYADEKYLEDAFGEPYPDIYNRFSHWIESGDTLGPEQQEKLRSLRNRWI